MNKDDYIKLKKQVQDKYQRAVDLAEKQRDEELEAVGRVWSLLHDIEETLDDVTEKLPSLKKKTKEKYGSLTKAIKQAIETVNVKFDKNDIMLVLRQTSPELAKSIHQGSLAGCLMRFVKKGDIAIHKRGKGSTPTVYKKKVEELFENQ